MSDQSPGQKPRKPIFSYRSFYTTDLIILVFVPEVSVLIITVIVYWCLLGLLPEIDINNQLTQFRPIYIKTKFYPRTALTTLDNWVASDMGKPSMWFPNRSDTNQPVQAQKMATVFSLAHKNARFVTILSWLSAKIYPSAPCVAQFLSGRNVPLISVRYSRRGYPF